MLHLYSLSRLAAMTAGSGCSCEEESRHEVKRRLHPDIERVVGEAEMIAPCLANVATLSRGQRVMASGIIEDAIIRLYQRDRTAVGSMAAVSGQTVGEYSVSFDAARPLMGFSSSGSVFNAAERKALRRLCGGVSGAYTVSMIGNIPTCGCGGCGE